MVEFGSVAYCLNMAKNHPSLLRRNLRVSSTTKMSSARIGFKLVPSFEIPAQNANGLPHSFYKGKRSDTLYHIGSPDKVPDQNMNNMEISPVQHFADVLNKNPTQNMNTMTPYQIKTKHKVTAML